jgi:Mrp family chromosome partitioning ATPase
VADRTETEFVTGARVLAVIRPREIPPERRRRRADRDLPPFIDPTSDAYRLLASHLAVAGTSEALATITGDIPAVVGVVAANIASVSANDSRSTLLVDADLDAQPISRVLRLPRLRGLADVLTGRGEWARLVTAVATGRDRALDVLASGTRRPPPSAAEAAVLREQLRHMARRYDLTIVAGPIEHARALRAGTEVLVCAQLGATPLRSLKQWIADLRDDGARVIGIVLWASEAPSIVTRLDAPLLDGGETPTGAPYARAG